MCLMCLMTVFDDCVWCVLMCLICFDVFDVFDDLCLTCLMTTSGSRLPAWVLSPRVHSRTLESSRPGYGVSVGAAESPVRVALQSHWYSLPEWMFPSFAYVKQLQFVYGSSHRSLILPCNCCLFSCFALFTAYLKQLQSAHCLPASHCSQHCFGSLGGELFNAADCYPFWLSLCLIHSCWLPVLLRSNYWKAKERFNKINRFIHSFMCFGVFWCVLMCLMIVFDVFDDIVVDDRGWWLWLMIVFDVFDVFHLREFDVLCVNTHISIHRLMHQGESFTKHPKILPKLAGVFTISRFREMQPTTLFMWCDTNLSDFVAFSHLAPKRWDTIMCSIHGVDQAVFACIVLVKIHEN